MSWAAGGGDGQPRHWHPLIVRVRGSTVSRRAGWGTNGKPGERRGGGPEPRRLGAGEREPAVSHQEVPNPASSRSPAAAPCGCRLLVASRRRIGPGGAGRSVLRHSGRRQRRRPWVVVLPRPNPPPGGGRRIRVGWPRLRRREERHHQGLRLAVRSHADVFADLRTNVHNFWDRGLLGMALHPNFPATPRVYVLYTYDAAIGGTPPRWGTVGGTSDPCPNPPGATADGCVVSGRLSILTAREIPRRARRFWSTTGASNTPATRSAICASAPTARCT